MASARIDAVAAVSKIIGPILGGSLAAISLRLPWAVGAAAFGLQAIVMRLFLRETLKPTKRVPFRWKRSSNPLAFLTLFRRGKRVALLAICHMWAQAFAGRFATFRYEQLHLTQTLGWGISQRARYASYRGLFELPATVLSGKLLQHLLRRTLAGLSQSTPDTGRLGFQGRGEQPLLVAEQLVEGA